MRVGYILKHSWVSEMIFCKSSKGAFSVDTGRDKSPHLSKLWVFVCTVGVGGLNSWTF